MTNDEAVRLARELRPCDDVIALKGKSYEEAGVKLQRLCDHILSGDYKREIENSAFERAARKADHLGELCDLDCTKLAPTDPETGARECSLEVRGSDCLCTAQREQSNLIAVRIRALIQPAAKEGEII